MKARTSFFLILAAVLAVGFTMLGCSSKNNLLKSISGKWQDAGKNEMVEIHLDGNNKSIAVNGKTYAVTVDKIEMINDLVNLKVQNGGGEVETWSIQQLWDNNGDSFKLGFRHGGKNDTLVSKVQS